MMTTQTDRAALIARLRECRYELIPYLLMRQAAAGRP